MAQSNGKNSVEEKIRAAKINDTLKQKLIKNWSKLSDTNKSKILHLLEPAGRKISAFQLQLTTVVRKIQSDIRKEAEKNETNTSNAI